MILSHAEIDEIDGKHFDFIILGGGINGIAIQKEASSRGYKTLLIDKNDFLTGATSHSSRLIHGGLRYLEYFEFELVYESLKSRQYLIDHFAHLVKPINLNIPILKKRGRPGWMIKAGLMLYDILSLKKSLPNHKHQSPKEFLKRFSDFNSKSLKSSYSYYDAQIEWPERLCLQLLHSIPSQNFSMNYVVIKSHNFEKGQFNFQLQSLQNNQSVRISADLVINASGPWVDLSNKKLNVETQEMGGTKGSHIVINERLTPDMQGIYVEAKQDGRPFFILPWMGKTLIGTTDIHYSDSLDWVTINHSEYEYLLHELKLLFPEKSFDKIQYTFSGIRPLPKVDEKHKTAKITRMHSFNRVGKNKKIIDVIGGKLTTFPELSFDLLGIIDKEFRRKTALESFFSRKTDFIPSISDLKTAVRILFLQYEVHLSDLEIDRMVSFYGEPFFHFLKTESTLSKHDFVKIHESLPQYSVELKFILKQETVLTWSDLFERRTDIAVRIGHERKLWNDVFLSLENLNLTIDKMGVTSQDYLNQFMKFRFSF